MLLYNLKLVFRNLLKNKLYSFLSISGFAISFAVCIIITLFAYNEYTVDHCYPSYSRIYRLVDAKNKWCLIDYNLNKVLSDNNSEVVVTCPVGLQPDWEFSVRSEERYTKSKGLISTSNDFFKLFSIRVLKSISNNPFSDKKTAVITESLAKKLFKLGEDPLGKSINIANLLEATISAIIEDIPSNSSIKATVLLNSENEEYRNNTSCNNNVCIYPINHYLLLNDKVTSEDFTAKLNRNIGSYKFAIDSIGLQRLSDIYLDSTFKDNDNVKGNRNLIIVFIAIGLLIMLLSVINQLNFNLSHQYAKLREIRIKRINGAGFKHLIGYFIADVSVSILISVDIALIMVGIFISSINGMINKQLSLDVMLNPNMIIPFLGVVILIILINSIAPFYFLSRFNIHNIFSEKKLERGKLVGRNILTAFQFIAAIALLTCVLIIQKQLSYAQNADLGFNKEHLLYLSFPSNFKKQLQLKHELNRFPFVVSSTLSNGIPGNITLGMGSGDTTLEKLSLACIYVDNEFLKTMNIELKEGRSFLEGDIGKACIMNQEAVMRFGWKDINGKRYNNGQKGGFEVVGVMNNFHVASFHSKVKPTCILSCPPNWQTSEFRYLSIRLTTGDVKSKIQHIEGVWKRVIPEDSMDFTFYDSFFDAMYRKEKLLGTIIMIFSILAIVLSCMGILGQVFQTCINRTKEIGIRKVSGASTLIIIRMLNFDFVKLIIIAFAIACPLSYYIMDKWLQNFAYKTAMNWWIFALSGLVILTISFVTVTWHSWRTASRNPIEALRDE